MNPAFTPGGSSGGEAALLASHGSLIGLGTDVGGSIRIPSHMNGLWGFKPSVRVSCNNRVVIWADILHRAGECHIVALKSPSTVNSMCHHLLVL